MSEKSTKPIVEESTPEVQETMQTYQKPPTFSLIDKAIADAHLLQEEGKIAAALEKWHSLVNLVEEVDNEVAARAWFSIGTLLSEQKKEKKALTAYDNAIRLKSGHAEAYTQRGNINDALGQYTAAIADYDEAIRLNPADAEAHTNRGFVQTKLGNNEAAIADHDEALRLNPNLVEAYHNRGLAKLMLGKHESAIEDFDRTIQLYPDSAVPYMNRGMSKRLLRQYEAAVADYEEAIRRDPEFAQPYAHRALDKIRRGQDEEARTDLEISLKLARAAGDEKQQSYVESWLQSLDKSEDETSNA